MLEILLPSALSATIEALLSPAVESALPAASVERLREEFEKEVRAGGGGAGPRFNAVSTPGSIGDRRSTP